MAYKTIEANFWQDPDVRKLSNEARLLLLFYITNPNSHYTGIYWIKDYMPLNELQWKKEVFEKATKELLNSQAEDRGMIGVSEVAKPHFFIRYDEEYALLWVKSMLRHQVGNKPLNSKQLKGLINHIKQFKQHPIIKEFLEYYGDFLLQTFSHYDKVIPQLKQDLESIFLAHSIGVSIKAAVTAAATEDKRISPEDSGNPHGGKTDGKKKSPNKRTGPPVNYEKEIPKALSSFGDLEAHIKNYIAMITSLNKTGKMEQSRQLSILFGLQEARQNAGDDEVLKSALSVVIEKRIDNLNYLNSVIQGRKQQKGGRDNGNGASNRLDAAPGKYAGVGVSAGK